MYLWLPCAAHQGVFSRAWDAITPDDDLAASDDVPSLQVRLAPPPSTLPPATSCPDYTWRMMLRGEGCTGRKCRRRWLPGRAGVPAGAVGGAGGEGGGDARGGGPGRPQSVGQRRPAGRAAQFDRLPPGAHQRPHHFRVQGAPTAPFRSSLFLHLGISPAQQGPHQPHQGPTSTPYDTSMVAASMHASNRLLSVQSLLAKTCAVKVPPCHHVQHPVASSAGIFSTGQQARGR